MDKTDQGIVATVLSLCALVISFTTMYQINQSIKNQPSKPMAIDQTKVVSGVDEIYLTNKVDENYRYKDFAVFGKIPVGSYVEYSLRGDTSIIGSDGVELNAPFCNGGSLGGKCLIRIGDKGNCTVEYFDTVGYQAKLTCFRSR